MEDLVGDVGVVAVEEEGVVEVEEQSRKTKRYVPLNDYSSLKKKKFLFSVDTGDKVRTSRKGWKN